MNFTEILDRAQDTTGLDKAQVEKALPAFLETLSLRLTDNEQKDLAAQLPRELKDTLHPTDPDVEKLTPDQFVKQFAQRADMSQEKAGKVVDGLWQTVAQAVSTGEAGDVTSQLPAELASLLKR